MSAPGEPAVDEVVDADDRHRADDAAEETVVAADDGVVNYVRQKEMTTVEASENRQVLFADQPEQEHDRRVHEDRAKTSRG